MIVIYCYITNHPITLWLSSATAILLLSLLVPGLDWAELGSLSMGPLMALHLRATGGFPVTWLEAIVDSHLLGPQLRCQLDTYTWPLHVISPPHSVVTGFQEWASQGVQAVLYGLVWQSLGSHVAPLLVSLQASPDWRGGNSRFCVSVVECHWYSYIVGRVCEMGYLFFFLLVLKTQSYAVTFWLKGNIRNRRQEKKGGRETQGLVVEWQQPAADGKNGSRK